MVLNSFSKRFSKDVESIFFNARKIKLTGTNKITIKILSQKNNSYINFLIKKNTIEFSIYQNNINIHYDIINENSYDEFLLTLKNIVNNTLIFVTEKNLPFGSVTQLINVPKNNLNTNINNLTTSFITNPNNISIFSWENDFI